MAKHFSTEDKQVIKNKILLEGKKLFEIYGLQKTSIDKIIDKVGIAKGSFYNLYSSKESMIFDLLMNLELELHSKGIKHLHKLTKEYAFPEAFSKYIITLLGFISQEPLLLTIKKPEIIQEIWMKINKEQRNRRIFQDESKTVDYIQIANSVGYKLTSSLKVFEACLDSFFMIYTNQNIIDESNVDALELIIQATINNLFCKI